MLLVLAYVTPESEEEEEERVVGTPKGHKSKASVASTSSEPRGGIRKRQNALSPELRLIDLNSSQEVDTDTLEVSRFERLSATDYHLGVLPAVRAVPIVQTSRGTLETLTGMGSGMWNATINATSLLSSGASVHSNGSKSDKSGTKAQSVASTPQIKVGGRKSAAHPDLVAPGMKIFIHSPYDCVVARKRDLSDHLGWLLDHKRNREAWELIDEHPEVISASPEALAEIGPGTPDRSSDDFFDDVSSAGDTASRLINSSVEKEKRRIGELWIQQLVAEDDWAPAGEVCGRVLGTSQQWKQWVYTFVAADKFDEITPFIPTTQLKPPLESTIYEVVLGHYIAHDRPRVRELLGQWAPEIFDITSVTTALENQLNYRDVREDSVEDGEVGRDWRIIVESMAKLYLADGKPIQALKCYMRLQDADTAMTLIKDYHLVDAVADDIPGLILLRVTREQQKTAPIEELRETTSEAITLLVIEAHNGLVRPETVVEQLEAAKDMTPYLFFYLSALWKGDGIEEDNVENRDKNLAESKALVDELADLAIHLFATYDRELFINYLKTSTYYDFEKVSYPIHRLWCSAYKTSGNR